MRDRALTHLSQPPKPVVLIPQMGDEAAPNFAQVKLSLEQEGLEVQSVDLRNIAMFAQLDNLEDLKFAFENGGAKPLDLRLKALVNGFNVTEHNVIVVPFTDVPKSGPDRKAYRNGMQVLQKLKTIQMNKNQHLETENQLVFNFLTPTASTDWNSDFNTARKIAALVEAVKLTLTQKSLSSALVIDGAVSEIPDTFKIAHS